MILTLPKWFDLHTHFRQGPAMGSYVQAHLDMGCAAGCFTGGCAPQLYAMAFEEAGVDLGKAEGRALFERFLSLNGPGFYGFPASEQQFQMEKAAQSMTLLQTPAGPVTPLPVGMGMEMTWCISK